MRFDKIICQAITKRRLVTFGYKGSVRVVEPYILGYDRADAMMLSAVQLSGGSGVGFRTFPVAGLSGVSETEQHFIGKHPDYNPRDRLFSRVLCQI